MRALGLGLLRRRIDIFLGIPKADRTVIMQYLKFPFFLSSFFFVVFGRSLVREHIFFSVILFLCIYVYMYMVNLIVCQMDMKLMEKIIRNIVRICRAHVERLALFFAHENDILVFIREKSFIYF